MYNMSKKCLTLILLMFVVFINVFAIDTTLEGGLKVKTLKEATNPSLCAVEGDYIRAHYTGKFSNAEGRVFDSSKKRGEPFEFQLGVGQVIPAWDVGIAGMCVGEVRSLLSPPSMAYGESGAGGVIPPGATLWFEVELIDVQKSNQTRELSFGQIATFIPVLLVCLIVGYIGWQMMFAQKETKKKQSKKN